MLAQKQCLASKMAARSPAARSSPVVCKASKGEERPFELLGS